MINGAIDSDNFTHNIVTTISAGMGNKTEGVAVDEATNTIYVTNEESGTVSVISGSSNTVIRNVTVGIEPIGVAVDQTTNRVYVANEVSNTGTVIDGLIPVSAAVIDTFSVGSISVAVAINDLTYLIYGTIRNYYKV